MVLMNSETFALLLAENIEIGSNQTVVSDNIGKSFSYLMLTMIWMTVLHVVIVAELVDANNVNDITFPDPNSNVSINNSISIPASYIQQQAMTTGKLST